MNKTIKKVLIILVSIILIYSIFLYTERFRFCNILKSKPIIVIDKEESEEKVVYHGMGYKMIYRYYNSEEYGKEIYAGEMLFLNIPLGLWIT